MIDNEQFFEASEALADERRARLRITAAELDRLHTEALQDRRIRDAQELATGLKIVHADIARIEGAGQARAQTGQGGVGTDSPSLGTPQTHHGHPGASFAGIKGQA